MKARRGQVALYLVAVLVGIACLVLMNVGLYLSVSAKNRTMNAGDAAALAVSRHQGELLNRIGTLNVDHLNAVVDGDRAKCQEIMDEQARLCFLGPLDGIQIGNEAARANGAEPSEDMLGLFKDHVNDIRLYYVGNPQTYPEPWEGAWEEYAQRLEIALGSELYAGPDNVDFMDAMSGHFLLDKRFYEAVRGRCWCWFHFNAEGLLGNYSGFRDWAPLPGTGEEIRRQKCVNSEIYSLGLDARMGSALSLFGTNFICRLTGREPGELLASPLLADETQVWYCYGQRDWRTWWEIDPNGEWSFPVVGKVRDEYDVRGCAACCRVVKEIPALFSEDVERKTEWTGAAKPFGTVMDERGKLADVTAQKRLVTDAFSDVRLVPLDTVGGRELSTADVEWMHHIRNHLPAYLQNGPDLTSSCGYCRTLLDWERDALREQARDWLKGNSSSCVRPTSGGSGHGGTPHGH